MDSTLKNEKLTIVISDRGAELQRIYDNETMRDFLWQGKDNFFSYRAPILFPNVATIKDGYGVIHKKKWPFFQHGFIKDCWFIRTEKRDDYCQYYFGDTEDTHKWFPYSFRLTVEYTLQKNRLRQKLTVKNLSPDPMPFGLGVHPAFCLEEEGDEAMLLFPQNCLLELCRNKMTGYLRRETRVRNFPAGMWKLCQKLFAEGAIITTGYQESWVELHQNDFGVRMEFGNAPHCVFWSPPGRLSYVCMEPWYSLPDYEDGDHCFDTKEGNYILGPGQEFGDYITYEILKETRNARGC